MSRQKVVREPVPQESTADVDLIAAWMSGDEGAASELVQRHAGALAAFLRGAGADLDDVEDLVQEAFFRAFRHIDSFRGGSAFRTWLCTIGSNVMKDLWRKRKRRQVIPLEGHDAVDEKSDPHSESETRGLEERFAECVAKLPPMQRDVFLMRAQQGADYAEIATALYTSEGSARVHYHHAVKRLKKMIGEGN